MRAGRLLAYRTADYKDYAEAVKQSAVYSIGAQGMGLERTAILDVVSAANDALEAVGSENALTFVFVLDDKVYTMPDLILSLE